MNTNISSIAESPSEEYPAAVAGTVVGVVITILFFTVVVVIFVCIWRKGREARPAVGVCTYVYPCYLMCCTR